jgi:hypothetical protein
VKLIYKPFGIIMGLLAGLVSKRIFDFIWARFDDAEAPKPTTREADWPKILGAAAVQGMVFKTTRAVVDRHGAKGFEALTGTWPGEKHPDPKGIDIGKK